MGNVGWPTEEPLSSRERAQRLLEQEALHPGPHVTTVFDCGVEPTGEWWNANCRCGWRVLDAFLRDLAAAEARSEPKEEFALYERGDGVDPDLPDELFFEPTTGDELSPSEMFSEAYPAFDTEAEARAAAKGHEAEFSEKALEEAHRIVGEV